MPGERLGQYMGHVGGRAVYNATYSGYGHLLDDTVLDCTFFSRHYCLPSHCNDYRGVVNRHTGEAGEANCEIVRGDRDEIWLVATRRISPGPRGYAELLTFYGEGYEMRGRQKMPHRLTIMPKARSIDWRLCDSQ
ncbi:hypothetical protein B484DRAFT_390224 [Ochromonadaceae sp. CCMP2298]|nr:hypothetical protein B484DRAFT_390224 [Ochromonadaceae sp. CCMP2298]